ncbi:SDR family NAD(P)-dependent oxidoreductase [Nonomuraea helvata]|uniref:SDR family NAD(P)-dependent oxidoreductase n=1 Tax=Nonomuraea helvata TaxID=37484 RepID=A0ABV5S717_9ACTN
MTGGARVAVVTGGANGIGLACVRRLSDDGFTVVVADTDAEAGARVTAEIPRAEFVASDVRVRQDVDRVVGTALEIGRGRLHALVNNAGQTARVRFADSDETTWRRLHDVNLHSVFSFTHACLAGLTAGRGAVVSVASVAGLVGAEDLSAYSSAKAGIIALTRSLALEHGDVIRFNAVCPGQIATRMMARVQADDELRAAVTAQIPAGRLGRPEEVAGVVAWLLSDGAGYVNGVAIAVDGGESAGFRRPKPAAAVRRRG